MPRPYVERREALQRLDVTDDTVETPPCWTGDAGPALVDAARELGLEGLLAKQLTSTYQPGPPGDRAVRPHHPAPRGRVDGVAVHSGDRDGPAWREPDRDRGRVRHARRAARGQRGGGRQLSGHAAPGA